MSLNFINTVVIEVKDIKRRLNTIENHMGATEAVP